MISSEQESFPQQQEQHRNDEHTHSEHQQNKQSNKRAPNFYSIPSGIHRYTGCLDALSLRLSFFDLIELTSRPDMNIYESSRITSKSKANLRGKRTTEEQTHRDPGLELSSGIASFRLFRSSKQSNAHKWSLRPEDKRSKNFLLDNDLKLRLLNVPLEELKGGKFCDHSSSSDDDLNKSASFECFEDVFRTKSKDNRMSSIFLYLQQLNWKDLNGARRNSISSMPGDLTDRGVANRMPEYVNYCGFIPNSSEELGLRSSSTFSNWYQNWIHGAASSLNKQSEEKINKSYEIVTIYLEKNSRSCEQTHEIRKRDTMKTMIYQELSDTKISSQNSQSDDQKQVNDVYDKIIPTQMSINSSIVDEQKGDGIMKIVDDINLAARARNDITNIGASMRSNDYNNNININSNDNVDKIQDDDEARDDCDRIIDYTNYDSQEGENVNIFSSSFTRSQFCKQLPTSKLICEDDFDKKYPEQSFNWHRCLLITIVIDQLNRVIMMKPDLNNRIMIGNMIITRRTRYRSNLDKEEEEQEKGTCMEERMSHRTKSNIPPLNSSNDNNIDLDKIKNVIDQDSFSRNTKGHEMNDTINGNLFVNNNKMSDNTNNNNNNDINPSSDFGKCAEMISPTNNTIQKNHSLSTEESHRESQTKQNTCLIYQLEMIKNRHPSSIFNINASDHVASYPNDINNHKKYSHTTNNYSKARDEKIIYGSDNNQISYYDEKKDEFIRDYRDDVDYTYKFYCNELDLVFREFGYNTDNNTHDDWFISTRKTNYLNGLYHVLSPNFTPNIFENRCLSFVLQLNFHYADQFDSSVENLYMRYSIYNVTNRFNSFLNRYKLTFCKQQKESLPTNQSDKSDQIYPRKIKIITHLNEEGKSHKNTLDINEEMKDQDELLHKGTTITSLQNSEGRFHWSLTEELKFEIHELNSDKKESSHSTVEKNQTEFGIDFDDKDKQFYISNDVGDQITGGYVKILLVMEFYSTDFYKDKPQGWAHMILPICSETELISLTNSKEKSRSISMLNSSSQMVLRNSFIRNTNNYQSSGSVGASLSQKLHLPIIRPVLSSIVDRMRYHLVGQMPSSCESYRNVSIKLSMYGGINWDELKPYKRPHCLSSFIICNSVAMWCFKFKFTLSS